MVSGLRRNDVSRQATLYIDSCDFMNNPQIDISVIIVNWNTKELLLECIKSIENNINNSKIEIIVIDNASNDGSVQALNEYFPDVKLIQNVENLGFARANNIGIKASVGHYICLVNSDVTILPGCFKELIQYMEENPSVGIIGPRILWPDLTLQDSCRKFPGLWNNFCESLYLNRLFQKSDFFCGEHMMFFDHASIKKVDGLVGAFLMVRKTALEEVGLFDEQYFIYSEETDLCKRFWKLGWEIVFFPDAQIIHYGRASSSKDPMRFSLAQYDSKVKYWKKHHNSFTVTLFFLFLLMGQGIRLISDGILYFIKTSEKVKISERLLKNYLLLKYMVSRKRDGGNKTTVTQKLGSKN
jgi:GT2 family glycosyltransferase